MTHVKLSASPVGTLTNLVDELFNGLPVFTEATGGLSGNSLIPVNILETPDEFRVDIIAPGFEKTDFIVRMEDKLLTIVGQKKKGPTDENGKEVKKIRAEYNYVDFKRSFTIDKKIDATGIRASYVNGVLRLNLPKKMDVKEAAKEITIN